MLMRLLAGEFIEIDTLGMMWSIVKIVIIPVIAGLAFNYFFHGKAKWLDDAMPILSMFGIAYIITIITAAGRDELLTIGVVLILAGVFHNISGYFLGYWGCRLFRMHERDCRTIALEVGMQNGGLASGIALEMGKVATVGLAPAVFGPVMNITGSSLATYWRGSRRGTKTDRKRLLLSVNLIRPSLKLSYVLDSTNSIAGGHPDACAAVLRTAGVKSPV